MGDNEVVFFGRGQRGGGPTKTFREVEDVLKGAEQSASRALQVLPPAHLQVFPLLPLQVSPPAHLQVLPEGTLAPLDAPLLLGYVGESSSTASVNDQGSMAENEDATRKPLLLTLVGYTPNAAVEDDVEDEDEVVEEDEDGVEDEDDKDDVED
ncbi:MAG: hypothetical protein MK075_04395, partial [Phycisphaerales bacterium]|nr:hypothetical protein [Phycisphaerales bacterium]